LVFWLSDDGFYQIHGGADIQRIGAEKVDRWFETFADANYPYRITSAIDPIRKLYVVSFPSIGSGDGTPTQILTYHWPTEKWSNASEVVEIIFSIATQTGYTLDTLDTLSGSIDALTLSLDSRTYTGSGRLLLGAFNNSHQSGFFDGGAKTAYIDTGDVQLIPGRKALLRSFRPIVEGPINVGDVIAGNCQFRDRQQDALQSTTPTNTGEIGVVPLRAGARYHRFKVQIYANDWKHAVGIDDVKYSPLGRR
jgi:hypothetical protein